MSITRPVAPGVVAPEPLRVLGQIPSNVLRVYMEQDAFGDYGLSDSGTVDAYIVNDGTGAAAASDSAGASDYRATAVGGVAFVTG